MKEDNSLNFKMKRKIVVFFIVLPILFGSIFYYLFCPDVWFVERIDVLLHLSRMRHESIEFTPLIKFLRFYLFDFLWAFSFAGFVYLIFRDGAKSLAGGLIIPMGIGAILELFQLLGIAQGTFDFFDILAETIGASLSVSILYLKGGIEIEIN